MYQKKNQEQSFSGSGESLCKVYKKKNTRELVTTSGLELLVVKLFEKLLVVKLTKIENGVGRKEHQGD